MLHLNVKTFFLHFYSWYIEMIFVAQIWKEKWTNECYFFFFCCDTVDINKDKDLET